MVDVPATGKGCGPNDRLSESVLAAFGRSQAACGRRRRSGRRDDLQIRLVDPQAQVCDAEPVARVASRSVAGAAGEGRRTHVLQSRASRLAAARDRCSRRPPVLRYEPASFTLPDSVDVLVAICTVPSPLPFAPAKMPVLDGPSTVHVSVATGPDAVWHT